MNWRAEYKSVLWILGIFLISYFMPVGSESFNESLLAAFALLKWYAQEHVLLCLVPAFFIAGVIAVFVSQASVIKYFGAAAPKWLSYMVASISGAVLAVCSCTVLPLFSGIWRRGAGLGPAIAFLYSGPAINILAIILTARILGIELGIARVVGAVVFSVVIGLVMHFIFREEESEKAAAQLALPEPEKIRPVWQTVAHFAVLVAILVFATWGAPAAEEGLFYVVHTVKWWLVAFLSLMLCTSLIWILKMPAWRVGIAILPAAAGFILVPDLPLVPFTVAVLSLSILLSMSRGEPAEWMQASWDFAKQILPLLGAGVLIAGFLLGLPGGGQGLIPASWVEGLVGGNSLFANFFASIVGAFMYFATLTEVPILQGLIDSGMGKGPALALLLAGPALSLPNMLVIRGVIGTQKTVVYVALVVIMATASGFLYGLLF